jgi:hypothetical protein
MRPDLREALKGEAIENTRRVLSECRLAGAGSVSSAAMKAAVPCVAKLYRQQRDAWRARSIAETNGSGRDEAMRPAAEHQQLEQRLQLAGFLPPETVLDGVYGARTRAAITAFQNSEALVADGLMTAATAERLKARGGGGGGVLVDPAADAAATQSIVALHARYASLEARLVDAAAQQARQGQLTARLEEAKRAGEAALAQPLPESIRVRVSGFLQEAQKATPSNDAATLGRLALEFDAMKPAVDDAVAIAKATTPKNGFLLEGGADDLLILYNDGGRAPSVVKNLRGDLVFETGRTVACQANGGTPAGPFVRTLNGRLQKWGQSLTLPLSRCNLKALALTDLVVVSRSELLKEKAADVATLLSAVDTGLIAPMITITGDEVKAAEQAQAVRVLEIETAVEKEGRPGYGVVIMETGSRIVCEAITRPEDRDAHELLLKPMAGRLAGELKGVPTYVATSVDAAFVATKRGQCGAIYAASDDLKGLSSGMHRDGIGFRYTAFWVSPEDLAIAKGSIADARTRETQQEADRRRRAEDDRRVADAKEKDDSVVAERRQAELQQQYGALARAFEETIRNEMKELVEKKSERIAQRYPSTAGWYLEQLGNRWELVSVDTNLYDYGMSDFKGRSLETAFACTIIKLRNRIRGEYAEHCFVTGFMSDKEFVIDRDHFEERCEDAGPALSRYEQGARFASRWLVPH